VAGNVTSCPAAVGVVEGGDEGGGGGGDEVQPERASSAARIAIHRRIGASSKT
jgi:hypothetical protein